MATALIEKYYLDLLHAGRVEGNVFYLPEEVGIGKPGQLSRESYVAVNEIITRIGGKWNRKAGGHVFEDDPKPLMLLIFETGEMPPKNPTAFYATPPEVADRLLTDPYLPRIPMRPIGTKILEPSAGAGGLVEAIERYCRQEGDEVPAIDCCEILPSFRTKLKAGAFHLVGSDFLDFIPAHPYDAVVMNPPFAVESDALAYITHIRHAMDCVRSGGVVLAVVPGGFGFRTTRKVHEFRETVMESGAWVSVEDGAFKASGTGVRTILMGWTKP